MSKVQAKIDGFMTVDGTPVLLAAGDEFDSDHPLVQARPELFTEPAEEPKRPVLSRVKGKGADD